MLTGVSSARHGWRKEGLIQKESETSFKKDGEAGFDNISVIEGALLFGDFLQSLVQA